MLLNCRPGLRRTQLSVYSQRYCNDTHDIGGEESRLAIKASMSIPRRYQSNVMCAGFEVDGYGSCYGDSGGPLMHFETTGDDNPR